MISAARESYDRLAEEYARRFGNEMDAKPFDRKILEWLAQKVNGLGPVCDMGCGPGQVARYLHSLNVETCGIDLSRKMVMQARDLNPDIRFEQGDMACLQSVGGESFGGIAAFYSLIHIPPDQIHTVLSEFKRVLRQGGILLVSFHIGRKRIHEDELWGIPVSLDAFFFETADMKERMMRAGLEVQEAVERDPYPPEVEYQSRRSYIFARKSKNEKKS